MRQGIRMKNSEIALCTVRDVKNFVKLLLKDFSSNAENVPKVGDKVKIIAKTAYDDNGTLFLEGNFQHMKLIKDDTSSYSQLDVSASPLKVSFIKLMFCIFYKNIFFSENEA